MSAGMLPVAYCSMRTCRQCCCLCRAFRSNGKHDVLCIDSLASVPGTSLICCGGRCQSGGHRCPGPTLRSAVAQRSSTAHTSVWACASAALRSELTGYRADCAALRTSSLYSTMSSRQDPALGAGSTGSALCSWADPILHVW